MDDAIQGLIDDAYAAAFDETLWPDWAWRTAHLLGGICGTLYVVEAPGRMRHQTILHEDVQAIERYVDQNIGRLDPQIAYAASLPSSAVYADTDHVDWEKRDTKAYFAWQASNGKMRHYLTAAARLNGGTHFAGLSVHRHISDGPTPHDARRIMERLLPHIHRSLELGFLHAEKMTTAYWDGMLTQRQEACLLLGEHGHVLRATPAMEALLVHGDGLDCVQGRLTCVGVIADTRLNTFVSTLTTGSAGSRTCRLDRPSGKTAYIMTGYPLPRRARMLAPVEAVALVTVVDPTAFTISTTDQWRAAYGLTPRETELASLLMTGHSVETAAAHLAITGATARVHLRNLFAKTETNRQSELVLLLSRLRA